MTHRGEKSLAMSHECVIVWRGGHDCDWPEMIHLMTSSWVIKQNNREFVRNLIHNFRKREWCLKLIEMWQKLWRRTGMLVDVVFAWTTSQSGQSAVANIQSATFVAREWECWANHRKEHLAPFVKQQWTKLYFMIHTLTLTQSISNR